MPASGHQDHTALPSASGALVNRTLGVHRSPLRVGDVAQRPSVWNGMAATHKGDLGWVSREISENQKSTDAELVPSGRRRREIDGAKSHFVAQRIDCNLFEIVHLFDGKSNYIFSGRIACSGKYENQG